MLSRHSVPWGQRVLMLVNWLDGTRGHSFSFLRTSNSELCGDEPKCPSTTSSFSPAEEAMATGSGSSSLQEGGCCLDLVLGVQTDLWVFPGCWERGVAPCLRLIGGFYCWTLLLRRCSACGRSPPSAPQNQPERHDQSANTKHTLTHSIISFLQAVSLPAELHFLLWNIKDNYSYIFFMLYSWPFFFKSITWFPLCRLSRVHTGTQLPLWTSSKWLQHSH